MNNSGFRVIINYIRVSTKIMFFGGCHYEIRETSSKKFSRIQR